MSQRINSISRNSQNNSIQRDHKRATVIKVHDNDVLSGRGVNIAHHPGNKRFRTLITSRQDDAYCTTYSASEKRAVAMEIIKHIQSLDPPGRFLRREGRGQVSRGLNGPWDVLTDKECVKKTCQALRDCNRTDRTGYAVGVDIPEDVARNKAELDASGLTKKEQATAAAAASVVATAVEAASNLKRARAYAALAHVPNSDSPYESGIPSQTTNIGLSLFPGKTAMDANKNMIQNHERNGGKTNQSIVTNNNNQPPIFPNIPNPTSIKDPTEFKRFSPSTQHAAEWLKKQRGLVNILPRTFKGSTNQNNPIIQPEPINKSTSRAANNYSTNNVQRNQNTSASNTSSILDRNTNTNINLNITTNSELDISNTNNNKTINGADFSYQENEKASMNDLFSQPGTSNTSINSMNMGITNDTIYDSTTTLANHANASANNLPINNMQSLELAHALNIFGSPQTYMSPSASTPATNMTSSSAQTSISAPGSSNGIMPLTVCSQPHGSVSVPGFMPGNMTIPMAPQFAGNILAPINSNLPNKNHNGLQVAPINMHNSNQSGHLRQQNPKNVELSQMALNNYNHDLQNVMGGDYDLGVSPMHENIVVNENLWSGSSENGNLISAANINAPMNTKATFNSASHLGMNVNLGMGFNVGMNNGTPTISNGSDNGSEGIAIGSYSQGMNAEI